MPGSIGNSVWRTRACLHSSDPQDDGDEIDHRGEACIGLFIARGDASERLDGAEEVFDEVAPFVLFRVMCWVSRGAFAQRNDRLDVAASQTFAQPVRIERLSPIKAKQETPAMRTSKLMMS